VDDVELTRLERLGELRPAAEERGRLGLEALLGVDAVRVRQEQRRGIGDRQ